MGPARREPNGVARFEDGVEGRFDDGTVKRRSCYVGGGARPLGLLPPGRQEDVDATPARERVGGVVDGVERGERGRGPEDEALGAEDLDEVRVLGVVVERGVGVRSRGPDAREVSERGPGLDTNLSSLCCSVVGGQVGEVVEVGEEASRGERLRVDGLVSTRTVEASRHFVAVERDGDARRRDTARAHERVRLAAEGDGVRRRDSAHGDSERAQRVERPRRRRAPLGPDTAQDHGLSRLACRGQSGRRGIMSGVG
mmetsp:Transcript_7159/g.29755  ORF Transcript_7159/g.29755 Transcript_7159/m.29755 type:complete len:255 (+) Transcript_7159:148-912(+)